MRRPQAFQPMVSRMKRDRLLSLSVWASSSSGTNSASYTRTASSKASSLMNGCFVRLGPLAFLALGGATTTSSSSSSSASSASSSSGSSTTGATGSFTAALAILQNLRAYGHNYSIASAQSLANTCIWQSTNERVKELAFADGRCHLAAKIKLIRRVLVLP